MSDRLSESIATLLRDAPDNWGETPAPDGEAVAALTAAGFVERRVTFTLRIPETDETVRATVEATGEHGLPAALEAVAQDLFARWGDHWEELAGRLGREPKPLVVREKDEWRLTEQGRLARADLESGNPAPLDFAMKSGFFDGQPRRLPDGRITRREPVRGHGRLVEIKVLPATGPVEVAVTNWGEGAEAVAAAFAGRGLTAAPVEPATPTPAFLFQRDGDGWFVRAFGREGHFGALVGFAYLRTLLASPSGTVSTRELVANPTNKQQQETIENDASSGEPTLDKQAKEEYRERLSELENDIARAREDCNDAILAELEKEKQALIDQLTRATGLAGADRRLGDIGGHLRSRVANALSRAYKRLRESGMNQLASHLENAIEVGGKVVTYRPDTRPDWNL